MKLLRRSSRPNDLDQCIELVRDGFLYDERARADLRRLWLELITSDTGRSAVIYEAEHPERILAFGFSAAVNAERYDAILTHRAPFIAKRLLDEWVSGKRPFLDEASLASDNAGDGLHLVTIHNGVAETLGASSLPAALSALSESYVEQHAGCNLKAFVHEAFGVPAQFALDLGLLVTDYAPEYEARLVDVPKDRIPIIVSMTRDEAKRHPGNLVLHQLFLRFTPPRCRLGAPARRLLRLASEGAPDERIAEILNIAPRTLKKRWADIYAIMEPVTGITPGLGNGKRGAEIRRHVLHYVREHPEALHAYAEVRPPSA